MKRKPRRRRARGKADERPYEGFPFGPNPKDRNRLHRSIDRIFDGGTQQPERIEYLEACVRSLCQVDEVRGREQVHAAVDRTLDEKNVKTIGNLYTRVADIEMGGLGLPKLPRVRKFRGTS